MGKLARDVLAMTLRVICTNHSKGNPRLSDVADLERVSSSSCIIFKDIGSSLL